MNDLLLGIIKTIERIWKLENKCLLCFLINSLTLTFFSIKIFLKNDFFFIISTSNDIKTIFSIIFKFFLYFFHFHTNLSFSRSLTCPNNQIIFIYMCTFFMLLILYKILSKKFYNYVHFAKKTMLWLVIYVCSKLKKKLKNQRY